VSDRPQPKYSLVIPVYRNEESLPELLGVLDGLAARLFGSLEVVMVVDGSPDNSYAYLLEHLGRQRYASQLVLLARNFGSFAAIREGLRLARGHYLAIMAADLQEPIDLIEAFFRTLAADEADVVVGSREARGDPWRQRFPAQMFWWVYRKLVNPAVPAGGADVFGCNRHFATQLLALEEARSSLVGQVFWLGHRLTVISYRRALRRYGSSAWTLRKKLAYLSDSLFAFSDLPIRILLGAGLFGIILAATLAIVVIAARISGMVVVPGYAALMVALTFFAGLNSLGLGLIGSYAWRAYENSKQRPLALVLRQHDFSGEQH
jgi:glycosyltransferase involved in cell wall biosynthesis